MVLNASMKLGILNYHRKFRHKLILHQYHFQLKSHLLVSWNLSRLCERWYLCNATASSSFYQHPSLPYTGTENFRRWWDKYRKIARVRSDRPTFLRFRCPRNTDNVSASWFVFWIFKSMELHVKWQFQLWHSRIWVFEDLLFFLHRQIGDWKHNYQYISIKQKKVNEVGEYRSALLPLIVQYNSKFFMLSLIESIWKSKRTNMRMFRKRIQMNNHKTAYLGQRLPWL